MAQIKKSPVSDINYALLRSRSTGRGPSTPGSTKGDAACRQCLLDTGVHQIFDFRQWWMLCLYLHLQLHHATKLLKSLEWDAPRLLPTEELHLPTMQLQMTAFLVSSDSQYMVKVMLKLSKIKAIPFLKMMQRRSQNRDNPQMMDLSLRPCSFYSKPALSDHNLTWTPLENHYSVAEDHSSSVNIKTFDIFQQRIQVENEQM